MARAPCTFNGILGKRDAMKNLIINQRGSSLVGALVTIVVMAAGSAAMIELATSETASSTNEMQTSQAMNVGLAGIEDAKMKLKSGISPDVANRAFSFGTYSIISSPASGMVTVTSQVGAAKRTQSINTSLFGSENVSIDKDDVYAQGPNLKNLQLVKSCPDSECQTSTIISKVTMDWNVDPCTYGNNVDYTPYLDPSNSNKVIICHVPPGNPENANELSVSINGWENGHSGGNGNHNWDYLGPCDGDGLLAKCDAMADEDKNRDGNYVDSIYLANTKLYDSGTNYGSPTGSGANANEEIILGQTLSMDSQGTYTFTSSDDINKMLHFAGDLPDRGWYRITIEFADGSTLTKSFIADQLGDDEEAPVEEETPTEESNADATPGYEEENGEVTVDANTNVKIEVLGSEITYGAGGPEISVYVKRGRLCPNQSQKYKWQWLWNKSDVDGGEVYEETNDENCSYKIKGEGKYGGWNESYTSDNTLQVKTLINGEQAPPLEGFDGQQPVTDFLAPLLDSQGRVVLQSNQVIMLFELGTDMSSDPNSIAADFQDLVILLTLGTPQVNTNENAETDNQASGDNLNILLNN